MKLQFLGANRQVTGSCYVLTVGGQKFMIDCGMFQERDYVARNWEPCPVPADQIDALVLTHAHIDHIGLVPRLIQAAEQADETGTPWAQVLDELFAELSTRTRNGCRDGRSLHDVLSERGRIGCYDGPGDLSTNPKHMEGLGEHRHGTDSN